jgi:hypothetical protein
MSLSIRSMLLLLVALSTSAKAGDVSVQLDSGAGFSVKNTPAPSSACAQRRTIARLEARIAELEMRPLYTTASEVAR